MRSAVLARAVEEGYHGSLMVGRHPLAIINISIPPREVDVNVHPTKSEVKFSHEQALFSTVRGAVRRVVAEQSGVQAPAIKTSFILQSQPVGAKGGFEDSFQGKMVEGEVLFHEGKSASPLPIMRVIGQMANAYIIAEGSDGLYLIDQHAAHERVLFEQIQKQRAQQELEVQGLMEPIMLELDARQEQLMKLRGEILTRFGFTVEPFGDRTYLIRAIPAVIRQVEITRVVTEIMDSLDGTDSLENWEESIIISLACHGAVRAGQTLNHEEMRDLIRQLEQSKLPRTCPHGRPTMIYLSSLHLAKEFGRTNPISR